jgi:hypothetical protein
MTVKELIEKLKVIDGDLPVMKDAVCDSLIESDDIEVITIRKVDDVVWEWMVWEENIEPGDETKKAVILRV